MTASRLVLLLGWIFGVIGTLAQECDTKGGCDTHARCSAWAEDGECWRSPDYMQLHCPVACASQKHPRRLQDQDICQDLHPKCQVWAQEGECEQETSVKQACRKSCGDCEDDGCTDKHEKCAEWATRGECETNPGYMLSNCAKSCDTCRKVVPDSLETMVQKTSNFGTLQEAKGEWKQHTLDVIQKSLNYMNNESFQNLPRDIQKQCSNKHALCSFWASLGECEKNKAWMTTNCAPACTTCDLIDINNRCPKIKDAVPALRPGDLNQMFQRIVETAPGNRTLSKREMDQLAQDNMTRFSVIVHSKPGEKSNTKSDAEMDKKLPPWIITFENFLTSEECEEMIELGYKYGYKRSEDVGAMRFDGSHDSVKSERRTSENAWCSAREGCRNETLPKLIHERMSKVMGIPAQNSEDLQILRYEVGQFYRTHHDYIPHQKDRQCGPRILTFFLYLSDVQRGGGTNFPYLDNLTIEAKQGRALLWPSVLNSDPFSIDARMKHQALEVEAGIKFAANGWIHMFDYVTPQSTGCN